MASRSRINAEERIFVSRLLGDEPALDAAIVWARRLNRLLQLFATRPEPAAARCDHAAAPNPHVPQCHTADPGDIGALAAIVDDSQR